MSTHHLDSDDIWNQSAPESPPKVDEGYWAALLNDGDKKVPEADLNHVQVNGWKPQDHEAYFNSPMHIASDHDWTIASSTFDNDQTIELSITGYNQGGLLVAWNSLRGFVPASQLVNFPVDVDEYVRREKLSEYVERDLKLRIIELDTEQNRLILSERAAQVEPGQRNTVLATLVPGSTQEGTVTNLCDFGAFVDLGGIEGLIHISELSWGRVGHPHDVLKSGQKVKVYIMTVDKDEERIALSLKRLQPDPWESVERRYEVGQLVQGEITNVVDFGAFACIEEGLEGLIHISELAEGQFLHPRNVVQEGETVQARILNIDGQARRLGLSLRQVNQPNGHHNYSDNTD